MKTLKEIRAYKIKMFGSFCQLCGCKVELNHRHKSGGEMLHTHHVDLNKKNNTICNLIILCAACHCNLHRRLEWTIKTRTKTPKQNCYDGDGIVLIDKNRAKIVVEKR